MEKCKGRKISPFRAYFLVDWGRFRARDGSWFVSLFLEVVAVTEIAIFEVTIPLRFSVGFVGTAVLVR